MPQPNITIQDSLTAQHLGRLWFNKTEYPHYRLFGTATAAETVELFVDGIAGNRIKVPDQSVTIVHAMYGIYNITNDRAGGGGFMAAVKNTGGTVALAGASTAVPAIFGDNTNNPGATLTLTASDANDALVVSLVNAGATVTYAEVLLHIFACTVPESNFGRLS